MILLDYLFDVITILAFCIEAAVGRATFLTLPVVVRKVGFFWLVSHSVVPHNRMMRRMIVAQ
jgi:hypothetical protein